MIEIIYGIHTVKALLELSPDRFQKVFVLKERKDNRLLQLIHILKEKKIMIQLVNRQYLNKRSNGAVHQGVIAYVESNFQYREEDLFNLILQLENPFLLILDGITDPHNLGACLRSANAAGVHAVIIPKHRSSRLNATVKKVACGAAEHTPLIRVTNLAHTMRTLKKNNIWIIGTDSEADLVIYKSKMMASPIALVVGEEGEGMRRLTREHCDELISIPMIGNISSLNVSVTAGICLFEVIRQRSYC